MSASLAQPLHLYGLQSIRFTRRAVAISPLGFLGDEGARSDGLLPGGSMRRRMAARVTHRYDHDRQALEVGQLSWTRR